MATNRPNRYWYVLVVFGWLLYTAVSAFGWVDLANIVSVIEAFLSAGILFVASRRSSERKHIPSMFLFGAYASFAWGCGDLFWAAESAINGVMPANPIMYLLYVLANVFLLIAITIYVQAQLGKWNRVQMVTDAVTILLLCTQFFWLFLVDRNFSMLSDWVHSDYTSILSVVTDIAIIVFVLTWKLAIRNGQSPRYFRTFAQASVLFALVDLLYYLLESKGIYYPNGAIDIVYSASLVLLAIAALFWIDSKTTDPELEPISNIGKRRTSLYLLIFPAMLLLLHLLNLIRVPLTLADFAACSVILLVHGAISRYIQLAIENDRLWKSEKKHSEMLEKVVADQAERLAFLANKDPLTLLDNRKIFLEQINEALAHEATNEKTVLLGVNIDRLKRINEAYGHDAGDKTVLELSKRLTEWNVCNASLARINGDEFGVLLPKGYSLADAERAGAEILKLCDRSFGVDGNQIKISLSIGIAQQQSNTEDAQALLEHMGNAIRQAKSQGYHTCQIYNPVFPGHRTNSRMENLLRQANLEKEFLLYYQPQVELIDRRMIGAEALLRWNNAEIGFIPPSVFIPVAEEIGMINEIGAFVLREAVHQAIVWNRHSAEPLKIGVNLSPKQIGNNAFVPLLREIVRETGMQAEWLDLEITESMIVEQSQSVQEAFSAFREMGISVSIDDFGSGFSAIGYLNQFHFDRIKIDKSLVDNVSYENPSGVRILKSIIEMSKAVGARTIAEGVETSDQMRLLTEIGCEQAQGYLFGRPVPPEEFERRFLK
jgi:diguanylate cyclase (GGDEF)-like protein